MTMSTLFMTLNLYGLVTAWMQEAHKNSTPCSSDVHVDKCIRLIKQTSISILKDEEWCRNHSEVVRTIGSILVLSLKWFHKHVQSMPPPKSTIWNTLSEQSCRVHNEKNFWKNDKYYQHTTSYSCKHDKFLCMTFHCRIIIQNTLLWKVKIMVNVGAAKQW